MNPFKFKFPSVLGIAKGDFGQRLIFWSLWCPSVLNSHKTSGNLRVWIMVKTLTIQF